MRDGKTLKRAAAAGAPRLQDFLDRYAAKITVVSGPGAGTGFTIDRERIIVGRGPGVDRAFDDSAMSRQHAAIEFCGTGFRLRDLGSTNGTTLNGAAVLSAELRHGDRFQIGSRQFLIALEARELEPDAYELKS